MKKIVFMLSLILLAGFVSGCTKKTTVQTNEGDVQVQQNGEQVTVNSDSGSLTAGENVSLPDGFPSDVHVADGTLTSALRVDENDGYSISLIADDSQADVKADYLLEMENDGWSITGTFDIAGGASIMGEKDNRMMTVSISEDNGETTVVVTTSTQE